jgi:uncharacterized membrane protein
MNQTHVHLLINHLPVFGSILGAIVLAHALWTKSYHTKIAAYNLFIISAIGAAIAYATGEAAADAVANIPGILKENIERHENFGFVSLVSSIILGTVSVVGLYLTIIQSTLTRTFASAVFFIAIINFALAARTGYLGGLIRHPEMNSTNIIAPIDNNVKDHDN